MVVSKWIHSWLCTRFKARIGKMKTEQQLLNSMKHIRITEACCSPTYYQLHKKTTMLHTSINNLVDSDYGRALIIVSSTRLFPYYFETVFIFCDFIWHQQYFAITNKLQIDACVLYFLPNQQIRSGSEWKYMRRGRSKSDNINMCTYVWKL